MKQIRIDVDEHKVIPPQSLKGKFNCLGEIVSVQFIDPLYPEGQKSDLPTDKYNQAIIGVEGFFGNPSSCLTPSTSEYKQIIEAYQVNNPQDLIGKPLISVYTERLTGNLTGIIPLYNN